MGKDISNFKLLYNKLSKKGICKYLSLYMEDKKIDCSKNKDKIISELEELFKEDKSYNQFIKFYLDTEETGQKHFYFYKFNVTNMIKENIEKFLLEIENETERKFSLEEQENWFYKKTDDEILIKHIEIKKTYIHDKELDKEDDKSFFKGYKIIYIPNVIIFRFFIKKQKVLIGIDKYSELDNKKDIEKKINDIFERICGVDTHNQLEGLIDKSIIEDFLFEQNVISYKIDSDINQDKKSVLSAKKGDLNRIVHDIASLKYTVEEVKIHNSDYDIKTHPTYLAEISKTFEDNSLKIDTNTIEIYWFTHKYKKPDYFRIKINAIDSSITTYSPSITKVEIDDVIYKII